MEECECFSDFSIEARGEDFTKGPNCNPKGISNDKTNAGATTPLVCRAININLMKTKRRCSPKKARRRMEWNRILPSSIIVKQGSSCGIPDLRWWDCYIVMKGLIPISPD